MAIMLNYDGVQGESNIQGYEKWINLESFQFGIG
ncbi:type VI secretion system tube protein Hcp, partial [Roseomonas hellenica]|nr:type VI secretion system tube protein Hcp [Plastoroseomonas hellenica]